MPILTSKLAPNPQDTYLQNPKLRDIYLLAILMVYLAYRQQPKMPRHLAPLGARLPAEGHKEANVS